MPMNHLSPDIPGAVWWTQQQQPMMEPPPKTPSSKHQPLLSPPPPPANTLWTNAQFYDHHHRATTSATPSSAFGFNLNQEDDDDEQLADERQNPEKGQFEEEQLEADKEPMFEKPLTPSDVGKLNRLVIPKQHAEKYFPLGGGGGDSGEKGLLLSFEDESGKCWRFRYSYWNSSQSYVLTKGWSRFVKDKRLDAGDVVLFERHRVDGDRLFIGWRRRSASATATGQDSGVAAVAAASSGGGGRGEWTRVYYSAHSYPSHPPAHGPPSPYQPDCLHAGAVVQNQTIPSGNSKRLRLFGVNLECQTDGSEPSTPDGSSMSSQGLVHSQYSTINAPASNPQIDNMDINFFTRDVNQMRYDHHG